ncbi:paraneoplastic antigen Ma2 homolog [Rana temporaria]|uniref:paraneoplastic antigen Ma2 homolog n=1 Tax=Rana temporaria TaxID=8407 RepID=UPI001AAD6BD4|nr:paraneoplastic antigen Ma2 homolog [Rana temporaria]
MDPVAITKWCKEENASPDACLVVEIKGKVWNEKELASVLKTLSPGRKPWVIDVKTNPQVPHTYALCEWKKGIPDQFKGLSVKAAVQTVLFLIRPDLSRGGTTSTSQATPSSSVGSKSLSLASLNPELCAVLGEIIGKCKNDPAHYVMAGYRKLRVFSGRQPVPSAEDGFEEWLDCATQALEEWEVPKAQKKQRVTESLKGPALEIKRNLKLSKKNYTAQDYLSALQDVYGRTEKATELLYQLEHCYQKEREKMSEFIRRLDRIIYQILLKKVMDLKKVDEVLTEQVIRSAQPLDPIALVLRTLPAGSVLEYPDLIWLVREEEIMLDNKRTPEA